MYIFLGSGTKNCKIFAFQTIQVNFQKKNTFLFHFNVLLDKRNTHPYFYSE